VLKDAVRRNGSPRRTCGVRRLIDYRILEVAFLVKTVFPPAAFILAGATRETAGRGVSTRGGKSEAKGLKDFKRRDKSRPGRPAGRGGDGGEEA
jgi:hypothetical protein